MSKNRVQTHTGLQLTVDNLLVKRKKEVVCTQIAPLEY